MCKWAVRFSALTFMVLVIMLPIIAQAQGAIPCAPEPTDMEINYGDLVSCAIDFPGDSDVFRFFGQTGERVVVDGSRSGVDGVAPCLELIAPNKSTVGRGCERDFLQNRIDATLNETGQHTILVTAAPNSSGRDTGTYGLSLQCLGGPCVPPPTPDVAGGILVKRSPVPGLTVILRNTQTGATTTTTTDPSGRYLFHPVEPGTYEITIKTVPVP